MRNIITCLLCLVCVLCSGCAALQSRHQLDTVEPGFYSGVRTDALTVAGKRTWVRSEPPTEGKRAGWVTAAVVDFPLSFAVDTAYLPLELLFWSLDRYHDGANQGDEMVEN